MRGIILAGGNGSRLRPLTLVANKHLLPIYDKPMILYPLETLKWYGVTDILIVSGGEHIGTFAEFLKDGSEYGVNLTYKVQLGARGIAQALGLAEDFASGEDVLVILGDNIFDNNKLRPIKTVAPDDACIFVKKVPDPQRFGVLEQYMGKPYGIEEKPQNPKSDLAVVGLYHYPNDVFDFVKTLNPSERGELEITDVNNHYLHNGRLEFAELGGFWSDAGTFDSLQTSAQWAKNHD